MKKTMKRIGTGILFSALIVFLCLPASALAATNRLNIGWIEGPQAGLNPWLARTHGDSIFQELIYEPLAIPMMDGSVTPWLAKSWEYDAAASTWTFHLDERAKWSDGTPLTAEDVKFTFETGYANKFPFFAPTKALVKAVEVVDQHTVAFKMSGPFAPFVSVIGNNAIMPMHIWSKIDKPGEFQNPDPVGSGPFKVKKFSQRAYLHLVKNDNYWRHPVQIGEAIIRIYSNVQAAVVALKKGELDIMPDLSGSETLIPSLMRDKNLQVVVERMPHNLYIAPNYRKHPLDVLDFRRAIDLAVNKQVIVETALSGFAEMPLMGYVPPLVETWANKELTWRGLTMSEADRVKEANALLEGLGYKKGPKGIRLDKDGKPLAFTIRCYTNPAYIRACELIKKDLTKIGIDIEVIVSDPETLYGGIVYSGKRPMDWDLMVHGSMVTPDPDKWVQGYASENPTPWDNDTAFGWKNEAIQSLLQSTRGEMDHATRLDKIMKAQKMFADELVVITLGHRFGTAGYRKDKFAGWNPVGVAYQQMFNPAGNLIVITGLKPAK